MINLKSITSLLLLIIGTMVFVPSQAQNGLSDMQMASLYQNVAFLNTNEILELMPEKQKAVATINDLNQKYKEELLSMQNDYNKKYSDFISYQNSMGDNIRLRRMQELYELERHISDFMKIAQKDIESKEQELIAPLREKLQNAINQVGIDLSFVCVYDLANPTILFVTPKGTDITQIVKSKLGIK